MIISQVIIVRLALGLHYVLKKAGQSEMEMKEETMTTPLAL
jgi:hypothetical protein